VRRWQREAHGHPLRREDRGKIGDVPGFVTRRAGIITVSTRGAAGERADERGPAMRERLVAAGAEVVHESLVPDDVERIATAILGALHAGANVVLTTGGTGLSPNDVNPEATRRVLDREVRGIAASLRARSLAR